jgi:hypothetical protein
MLCNNSTIIVESYRIVMDGELFYFVDKQYYEYNLCLCAKLWFIFYIINTE